MTRQALARPAASSPAAAAPERPPPGADPADRRIRRRDLAVFSSSLASLQRAGIPILKALHGISGSTRPPGFQAVLLGVSARVERGALLSEALGAFPRAFDPFFASMVAVGESTGKLDEALDRLAEHLEREEDLKGQIQGALAYPAFASVIIAAIIGFILIVVVPRFARTFEKTGIPLPLPTQAVLGVSGFLRQHLLETAAAAAVLAFGYWYARGEPLLRRRLDRAKLALPVLGPVVLRANLTRFARSLQMLFSSGVPILSALELVRCAVANQLVADEVGGLSDHIARGGKIADYVNASELFPPMACQMLAAGEASGNLGSMLGEISRLYQKEIDRALKLLVSLLEPALIAVLGLVVGGILIALLLPMFAMVQGIGR